MFGSSRKCLTGLVAAIALFAASTVQGAILYGSLSGDTVDFQAITEDSGTDPTPLYGPPSVDGDTLKFTSPTANFSAWAPQAIGDVGVIMGDTTDGKLTVKIVAKPGETIESISLSEWGDFTLTAAPNHFALVTAAGTMFANTSLGLFSDNIATVPTSPMILAPNVGGPFQSNGQWVGSAFIDLSGLGLTEVELTVDNTLQALVTQSANAFIAKKYFEIGVVTIPEPATLVLMGMGATLVLWRRRQVA